MLKEVRDSGKYVTDANEFLSVVNKLCKTQLSLELVQ